MSKKENKNVKRGQLVNMLVCNFSNKSAALLVPLKDFALSLVFTDLLKISEQDPRTVLGSCF